MSGVYDVSIDNMEGRPIELSEYKGKVLLIVNVASRCGYTPQYKGLQALHEKYESKGLCILAFPCNDFADQEPGSEQEIREFCDSKYGVKFYVFAKIKIRGSSPHPLYGYLEALQFPVMRAEGVKAKLFQRFANMMFWLKVGRSPGVGEVQWNFHKFIISQEGEVKGHFASDCDPFNSKIITCIEQELGK